MVSIPEEGRSVRAGAMNQCRGLIGSRLAEGPGGTGRDDQSMTEGFGIALAGLVMTILGIVFLRKQNGYFSPQTWRSSRVLRVVAPVLFFVPGLEPERQFALHADRYGHPERLVRGARTSRVIAAYVLLGIGAVCLVVALLLSVPN